MLYGRDSINGDLYLHQRYVSSEYNLQYLQAVNRLLSILLIFLLQYTGILDRLNLKEHTQR